MNEENTDRHEAARKVLAVYDAADPCTISKVDTVTREKYAALETLAAMAKALRALLEPPTTIETVEQITMQVYMGIHSFPALIDGDIMRDLISRGVLAGIQAEQESWEL